MKLSMLLCLVTSLGAGSALGWNHVTEASFRKALRSNEYTLVAFVEPSQPASAALKPEWTSIQETERDNNVVSLDCGAKRKLCDEFHVISYPAIRLYHQDGRMDRYRGPRRAKEIVPFLRRALRPTVSRLDDKNITSFIGVDDVVLVAQLEPQDRVLEQAFLLLAGRFRDRYSFAVGPPPEHARSSVGCFNNREGEQRSSAEFDVVGSLERFVALCAKPVIVELTRRNEMENMQLSKSLVHYFISSDADRGEYLAEMRPLAQKYREYLQFTTIDVNEYPEMLAPLGQAPGASKGLSVFNPSNGDVFPYTGGQALSAAVVEAFLMDIISGKVQALGKGGQGSQNAGASTGAAAAGDGTGHDEL
ncbi:hypothetical protein RB595_000265 [Gaeumannomyces hyphopodioides]